LQYLTLKEIPEQQRPRERLLSLGASSLSDIELLAIILRTGAKNVSAIDLAGQLLKRFDNLRGLLEASIEEMAEVKGIGKVKAVQIKAALEISRRLMMSPASERVIIKSPDDVAALVMNDMRNLDKEYFRILLLNTKNHVLSIETINIGTLNSSMVHPREIFKAAIKKSAAALILLHNHPSGDPSPSRDDINITKRIIQSGDILGISVLDHIIIGDNRFISLRTERLI